MPMLTVQIDSFAHGGFGVARHDGRVIFVADALPGETVDVDVIEEKRSFARAVATAVSEPSPHRVPHIWAEAHIDRAPGQRPGGADLGFASLDEQRRLKEGVIADALARFAGGAVPVTVEPVEPNLGWRTRVRLHVDRNGVAGPLAARSHSVIEVAEYPLAASEIAERAPWAKRYPDAEFIDLAASSTGQLHISTESKRGGTAPIVLTEQVNGREFTVDSNGFWQVHRAAPQILQRAVTESIRADLLDPSVEHYDLYGGVGLLAVPVLEAVGSQGKIVTVESSRRATEHAQRNLSDWVGSRAVTAPVERFLTRETIRPGATVVIDPPRSGAGRAVVNWIATSAAAQLIYVACDPVAFARDLGWFRAAGWDVEWIRGYDLFPQTHHVELVARLIPNS